MYKYIWESISPLDRFIIGPDLIALLCSLDPAIYWVDE
jgi:hypothetical protein